jgi:hypothetical protein
VLPADRYARLAAALADERAAAEANAQRLTPRASEVEAALTNVDAESETLTRLAELHAAIAGRVMDAPGGDIGALRAALAAVCSEVRLRTVEDGMVVLDYIPHDDEWRRVGLGFAVEPSPTGGKNMSVSGVPE